MQLTDPQISVAIASYNGCPFILPQLESIVAQTVLPVEIVIVDDASQDETTRIVQSFSETSSVPLRLITNERNLGSTESFSRAIRECKGDWIALADQDDVWLPNKLELLIRKALSGDCDAVFSDAELVDKDLNTMNKRLFDNSRMTRSMRQDFRQGHGVSALLKYNVVTGATMMFRASWKERLLPVASGWVHDYWMALIIASSGKIGICEEPLILYRQHGQNQIGANSGFRQDVNKSLSKSREAYLVEAGQFAGLRFAMLARGVVNPSVIRKLREKECFLQRRYLMGKGTLSRLSSLVISILQGDYFKYGFGWRPLLKDFLLP